MKKYIFIALFCLSNPVISGRKESFQAQAICTMCNAQFKSRHGMRIHMGVAHKTCGGVKGSKKTPVKKASSKKESSVTPTAALLTVTPEYYKAAQESREKHSEAIRETRLCFAGAPLRHSAVHSALATLRAERAKRAESGNYLSELYARAAELPSLIDSRNQAFSALVDSPRKCEWDEEELMRQNYLLRKALYDLENRSNH